MHMSHYAPTLRRLRDRTSGWQLRCMAAASLLIGVQVQPLHAAVEPSAGPVGQSESERGASSSDDRLTVSRIHGRAFHIQEKGTYRSLQDGASVSVNRPVKVGPKSRLDLELRDGGTLELGPAAQLVLYPAWRAGREDSRVTGLRLDNGYLRVSLGALPPNARFEVSFGKWLAELRPGEYVFDTRTSESSVCVLSGQVRMSGLPEGTAAPEPDHCMRMTGQASAQVTLAPEDWTAVRTRRALLPVVTEVSRRQRNEALTRLEDQFAVNPDSTVSPHADPDVAPLLKMPKIRLTRLAVARPVSSARTEALARNLDRTIARQQARLAETLLASAPPQAGPTQPPAPVVADPIAPPAAVATTPTEDSLPAITAPPVAEVATTVASASASEPFVADATARPASLPSPMEVSLVKVSVHSNNQVNAPVTASPIAPLVEGDASVTENAPLEWIVNVATHPSLEAAELQAAQLNQRNFRTSIRRETVRGRSSYRVVIEGLATEQAANTAVRTLGSEMGLRQAWVFRKR